MQEATVQIHNALLLQKRVVFLGYQQPASVACKAVLSACLLISPPFVGTLERAVPYANLTNMEFLSVEGFIAGVTNPLFEQRDNVRPPSLNFLLEAHQNTCRYTVVGRSMQLDDERGHFIKELLG